MSLSVAKDFAGEKDVDQTFLTDVLCFFAGSRAGHVDRYGYSSPNFEGDKVQGGPLWSRFVEEHKGYYPFQDEPRLIAEHVNEIASTCRDATQFVELGVGSLGAFELKTLPVLEALLPIHYVAADINHDYAEDVVSLLKQRHPEMQATFKSCDFFEELPRIEDKSLLYLVGTTISNIEADLRFVTPQKALIKNLSRFANALKKGSHFVLTFDANQNEEDILAAYNHPRLAELNINFIELIKRELPTDGLFAEDFQHIMTWCPDSKLLTHEVAPRSDIKFSVAGHAFTLKAGTHLHQTNCFKFDEADFCSAAAQAGFEKTEIYSLQESSMRLATLTR